MDKEVLIHVGASDDGRGRESRNRWRSLYRDSIISAMEAIICVMRKSWKNGRTYDQLHKNVRGTRSPQKGKVNVHMVFEQGKKNMTYYTTPFGTLRDGDCRYQSGTERRVKESST